MSEEIYNVKPNISDPEMMPIPIPISPSPPSRKLVKPEREEMDDSADDVQSAGNISRSTSNRNLIIILVVLAVVVILFLAYMYFYRGQDLPAAPLQSHQFTPPLPSPPITPIPPMTPMTSITQQQCTRLSNVPPPRPNPPPVRVSQAPMPSHEQLVRNVNNEELNKLLKERKLKQTHDNYPSEQNKPAPSSSSSSTASDAVPADDPAPQVEQRRLVFAEAEDNEPPEQFQETPEEEPYPTAPTVMDDDGDEEDKNNDEDKPEGKQPPIAVPLASSANTVCGAPLKTGGTCRRRTFAGERCQQHKK